METKRVDASGLFVQLDELYKTMSNASSYGFYERRKLARKKREKLKF
jgi:hypothetical protein